MPIGNESRASWPSARAAGHGVELAADRLGDGALQADAGAPVVRRPRLEERARGGSARPGRRRPARRRPGPGRAARRAARVAPTSPSVQPSSEASTSVLRVGAALEHARQLDQGGGVGGAAGGVGHHRGVPVGDDHDLAARAPGAAADHVHEPLAGVAEALRLDAESRCRRTRGRPARPCCASPIPPGRRSGAAATIRLLRPPRRGRRTARPRRVPAATAGGRLCSENIVNTSASSAGMNAAL